MTEVADYIRPDEASREGSGLEGSGLEGSGLEGSGPEGSPPRLAGTPKPGPDERRFEFTGVVQPLPAGGIRLNVRVPDIRCAACTFRIEQGLRQLDGVTRVRTSLVDRVVSVDADVTDPLVLVEFIEGLGFTVLPDRSHAAKQALRTERKAMLARLGVAGIGMMQVMMFAFATYLGGNVGTDVGGETDIAPAYVALMHWASLVIAIPVVLYSAMPFHQGALRDLSRGFAGMDVPISLAILAAFVLSTWNTLAGTGPVYFDSVAMFTFLLLVGRFVELESRRKYLDSQLLTDSLLPASALLADGRRVPVAELSVDDLVTVRAGESMPVDGFIVAGETSVVEMAFTGESRPVGKGPGARVLAGSDNLDGAVVVRVSAPCHQFVITQLSNLYRESAAHKPAFANLADRLAQYVVAAILLLAAAAATFWYLAGSADWFSIGLAVLVVSCPCALSLATPVAYAVAVAALRQQGIVVSNGELLERLDGIDRIVFDKSGTLTRGRPRLTAVRLLNTLDEMTTLGIAAAIERDSRHPIATALFDAVRQATQRQATVTTVVPGGGVTGTVDGVQYRLGKPGFALAEPMAAPTADGNWVLLASDVPLAWLRFEDDERDEAAAVVSQLGEKFALTLLTGDASPGAQELGARLGFVDMSTGMSPAQKLARIREFQEAGESVLMIGDGINDAAALAAADAAVAVSPVDLMVQESAGATLLTDDLRGIPLLVTFSRRVNRVIRQNLAWAACYNLALVPLAVTGLVAPWMAALGMSLSSVMVVLNANRLHRGG